MTHRIITLDIITALYHIDDRLSTTTVHSSLSTYHTHTYTHRHRHVDTACGWSGQYNGQ